MSKEELEREPEYRGPVWKHPYMIYVALTAALFLFLVILGWIALTNNWIPAR